MLESVVQAVLGGQTNAVARNLDAVRRFKSENQIKKIDRFGTQLVDQRRVWADLGRIEAEHLGDTLPYRFVDLVVANVQNGVDRITNLLNLRVINHMRLVMKPSFINARRAARSRHPRSTSDRKSIGHRLN